jgi:hypothetical protein
VTSWLLVDAARIRGDQRGQRHEQGDRDHPAWLHPVPGRQGHVQPGDHNDRHGNGPPVLALFGSRRWLGRGRAGLIRLRRYTPS